MVFGIVVEGEYDSAVYSTLIRQIRPGVDKVLPITCGGVVRLQQKFVGWLKHFQWHPDYNYKVGKVLVVRDSDCRDSQAVEEELDDILSQSGFQKSLKLPVHFHATKCMVETLLLADESAVNAVARQRGRSRPSAQSVRDPLEGTVNAKGLFQRMLSQAQLPADLAVYAEVAAAADIERIKERCPNFRRFIECVHAC